MDFKVALLLVISTLDYIRFQSQNPEPRITHPGSAGVLKQLDRTATDRQEGRDGGEDLLDSFL